MKQFRIEEIKTSGSFLMPDQLGDAKITHGGVYVFKLGPKTGTRAPRSTGGAERWI